MSIALRGIWGRRGVTATILAVAVVATAAATVGPVYFEAAGTSILQDTVRAAPAVGQGIDVSLQSDLSAAQFDNLNDGVRGIFGASPAAGEFGTPINAIESTGHLSGQPAGVQTVLAWRDGACANLQITEGHCAVDADEVIVSADLASKTGLHIGQRLNAGLADSTGKPVPVTITGLYRVANPYAQYWFDRPYFKVLTTAPTDKGPQYTDALFTPRATFTSTAAFSQGTDVVDLPLDLDNLSYGNADAINTMAGTLTSQLPGTQVNTTLPTVLDTAQTSQQALAAPVFLVTAQLLVLCWLLLFLLVTDAAEARGNEVALAKLRGLTRRQTVLFGLSEQVVLMLLALPIGAIVGWLASKVLAGAILRSGTPVPLVGLGWAAAAVSVAGGALAAAAAARRTLSRPVLAQWNRVSADSARRGWVMDAAIAVLAVAALAELFVSGVIGNANHNPLALLAPGLIALTIALLSSRLLPVLARGAFGRTARHGGLGPFLAVRQVARRPGSARTTVALTTAFGLVTFTIAAWSVVGGNIHDTAWTETGAAQVLTVNPPQGVALDTIVDRLDPSGDNAVTVERENTTDANNNEIRNLLAVDPARFAHVAYWRNDFSGSSLAALTAKLGPREPAPISILGDQLSITVNASITGGATGAEVYAQVLGFEATGLTPVDLGPIGTSTSGTLTGTLPNCAPKACVLRQIYLEPNNQGSVTGASYYDDLFAGSVTVDGVSVHDSTGWHSVDAGLGTPGHWAATPNAHDDVDKMSFGSSGLSDAFSVASTDTAAFAPVDAPAALPAIVTGSVLGNSGNHPVQTYGLDGDLSLNVRSVGVATALPGAGTDGLIVDRNYAELASTGVANQISQEVWLSPTAPADFAAKLQAAGVGILTTTTATATADQYSREGPALALVLFLADAAAAAILAAGGAVLGLHLAGRRRSYELAALAATGARKRALGGGLLIEQGLTLGFGALFGIGAGLLATVLAVPSIPEFVNLPDNGGAPLHYAPSASELATLLGIAVVLLAAAAVGSALALIRSVRPDQLREAAP